MPTLVLVVALLAAVCVALYLARRIYRQARRRAHRRRVLLHREPLTDREVADALAPLGADISIWPSRAPRNGTTHDPVE